MKVIIIGSGNTATVVGRKIVSTGHAVLQVMSRNSAHAQLLAEELQCAHASDWESVWTGADIYLLAISDNGLYELNQDMLPGHPLVAHMAGAVSRAVLEVISDNHGVLYPLQSLRRELPESPEIPFLVDANSERNREILFDFAKSLSPMVFPATDAERMSLHLSATFVNNFSNHLYTLAEAFCKDNGVEFQWLLPLIEETGRRLKYFPAKQLQTGPAIRQDLATIHKHLSMLNAYPSMKALYEIFSRSIGGHQNLL